MTAKPGYQNPAPQQVAIDEKSAGLKPVAGAKFGSQAQPAQTFITGFEQKKWIHKHQFNELRLQRDARHREQEDIQRRNIEFAKDLFISWDDDGSGVLEADEIIKPLISLGLAPNSDFAVKLLQALDPRAKAKKQTPADLRITLQDFIRIFRGNKVSEALFDLIQRESERRLKCFQVGMPLDEMPQRRYEHPNLNATNAYASDREDKQGGSGTERSEANINMEETLQSKKLSIMMRA